MNPHQKNKVDLSSLSADEQRLFRLYGKLPNKKDLLQNKLKERKYFDSGDYALSKAGKAGDNGVTTIGTEHPNAEDFSHKMHPLTNTLSRGDSISSASPPSGGMMNGDGPNPANMHRGSITGIPGGGLPGVQSISRSPNKEASHLARSASMDEHVEAANASRLQGRSELGDMDEMDEMDRNISPPPRSDGIPIRK